jgi:cyclophilin family peptidyl-prolyl cis-trans isomerase
MHFQAIEVQRKIGRGVIMKNWTTTVLGVLALAVVSTLWGADPPAAVPKPGPQHQQPGPQNQQFDKLFGQWKDLMAQLWTLQEEYRTAKEDRQAEIEKQYKGLVEKGTAMEPELIGVAEKAYAEAPGANADLPDFLLQVVKGEIQHDRYDHAAEVGELLLKHGFKNDSLNNAYGIAAFALARFDEAEKYLELAKKAGALDEAGRKCLFQASDYKALWVKEQQLRAAEAKAGDLPRVLLKTSKGDIELELFENEAPNTVANFIQLVEKGYYDGLTFHRVIRGFMAQGGCPKGDGTGGPGYYIPCECYQPNARMHFRGTLSMAHAGRDTGGSQFFLTFLPTGHLNGKHTVFGRVVQGLDVLAELQTRDPSAANPPSPDRILEAKVLKKRNHPYEPRKLAEH